MFHTLPIVFAIAVSLLTISGSAQLIVAKSFQRSFLEEHHRVVEPLLGVVGTSFSVLLGFMVAGAMDRYEDSMITVDLEANSVANVFRLAQGLETVDRVRMRNFCRIYAARVVSLEWGEMKHRKPVIGALKPYQQLWEASLAVNPGDNERISNIQQSLLEAMNSLGENRRLRIVASQHGLGFVQWLVVGAGSCITVLLCLFFPMSRMAFHAFLTGLVTMTLGLNIWLLAAYSTPFAGEFQIQPYMFDLNAKWAFCMPDTACRYLREADKAADNKNYND